MSRWNYSNKYATDDCKIIGITWLKQVGYLDGIKSGNISWSIGENKTGSAGIFATIGCENENYIRLTYTITDNQTNNKTKYDYKIPIISTKCNFGNKRYWFKCQLSKNGKYCERKVANIYLPPNGQYFGCRHCYELNYKSQKENQRNKYYRLFHLMDKYDQIHKLEKEIKVKYYNGKPTRKLKKIYQIKNSMASRSRGFRNLI